MTKYGNDAFRKDVANKIQVQRWVSEMSQEQLADKLGTSKSSISRIESGRENISVDYIQAIADAFGKDVRLEISDKTVDYSATFKYSFRLYDDELFSFSMDRSKYQFGIEILSVNEDMRHLLPLDMELTPEGVFNWLHHRAIPKNREMVSEILDSLGLEFDDLKGLVDVCFALSLNDSYWVVPLNFDGGFRAYNLYQNRFNSVLSLIAYVGYGGDPGKFVTSPELTTGGMLRKAWSFKDQEDIWLYKSGTEGFANAGNEPYCEFYASQVAQRMGLHAVKYELENWHGITASKCRLFTDIDTSFVPIGRIVTSGGIDACIEYYKKLGDDFYQELASMLVFDAIVMNEDRHYGNFGILRNNHTGEIVSPAPIFDNGISLLCYAMKDDFGKNLPKYLKERSNPYGYGNQYFDLCRKVIGPTQKAQVRRLLGFRFRESDISNLPSWRLHALEQLIQDRVHEILNLK